MGKGDSFMFKRKNEEKQYKYSLRKIRGRGGVASCIIGAVVFGSILLQHYFPNCYHKECQLFLIMM